jgi:hypothetical protein
MSLFDYQMKHHFTFSLHPSAGQEMNGKLVRLERSCTKILTK